MLQPVQDFLVSLTQGDRMWLILPVTFVTVNATTAGADWGVWWLVLCPRNSRTLVLVGDLERSWIWSNVNPSTNHMTRNQFRMTEQSLARGRNDVYHKVA